ncbi:MAG: rhodanese y domain superfamily protein [Holophagaceae bacterium]|nr:rhodanese y domain superfamily protein [Holophagaceae bacterium]
MKRAFPSTALQVLALAALAAAAALLSNAVAPSNRRLAWTGAGFPSAASPAPPVRPTSTEPPVAQPAPRETIPLPSPTRPSRAKRSESRRLPDPPAAAAPQAGPIREISGQEAWDAFQASWPFLDARRSAEFAEGHIPGAWSTPVWEADLDDRLIFFKAARRPGPEDPIVIYCSGGDCRDSHLLAARLMREGYGHLLIFRDGFPAWVAQGHPVDKGRP